MRVISGKYKGRKLVGFNIYGTRPTMDRVKESLFAIIQDYLKDGVVLDLFAGSGSLGIEALSNGSKECYFVDINKECINVIEKNTSDIEGVVILKSDWEKALSSFNIKFDIIFLDPPYGYDIEMVIDKIIEYELINSGGIIVCESEKEINSSLELIKSKCYKDKWISVLKRI